MAGETKIQEAGARIKEVLEETIDILERKPKYPWDYRVEYFEVATTYPCFECGPLHQYQPAWSLDDAKNSTSELSQEILKNFHGWAIFTFTKALSSDQKTFGAPQVFCGYPLNSRYNFGSFGNWKSGSYPSYSTVSSTNTKTRFDLVTNTSKLATYSIRQGNKSVETTETLPDSGRRLFVEHLFPILLYAESGSYQLRNVYAGTRIYEVGIDITPPSFDSMHVRFVPCMKNGVPYICEMNSGTMIANSKSGTVMPGPQVADDYSA